MDRLSKTLSTPAIFHGITVFQDSNNTLSTGFLMCNVTRIIRSQQCTQYQTTQMLVVTTEFSIPVNVLKSTIHTSA